MGITLSSEEDWSRVNAVVKLPDGTVEPAVSFDNLCKASDPSAVFRVCMGAGAYASRTGSSANPLYAEFEIVNDKDIISMLAMNKAKQGTNVMHACLAHGLGACMCVCMC